MQTFLLILATTVLTCSSLCGFHFLHQFAASAVTPTRTEIRRRITCLVLALLAFLPSFGSGWLLSHLLAHA
ncbi:MAG: hypothetical protein WDN28_08640 [Chthoniobacter sp.]